MNENIKNILVTIIILVMILVIGAIILVGISIFEYRKQDSVEYQPIYFSKEEVEDLIQKYYGEKWKVQEEPEVSKYQIVAAGTTSRVETKEESVKKYKYKVYMEGTKNYFYVYSTTEHEIKSNWNGGIIVPKEYRPKIYGSAVSELIKLHKKEINNLALENNIICEIQDEEIFFTDEAGKLYIHVSNEGKLENVANFLTNLFSILDIEELNYNKKMISDSDDLWNNIEDWSNSGKIVIIFDYISNSNEWFKYISYDNKSGKTEHTTKYNDIYKELKDMEAKVRNSKI